MRDLNVKKILAPEFLLICEQSAKEVQALRNQKILITGGTGFFGKWLTLGLLALNEAYDLKLKLLVLSRNPESALSQYPWIYSSEQVQMVKADILDLSKVGVECDYIFHAATDTSVRAISENPRWIFDVAAKGTLETLRYAKKVNAKKILITSSGAIYGKQPESLAQISESDYFGIDPLDSKSAYALGKNSAELFCVTEPDPNFSIVIARCFAFVGPFLPLDKHFAIGNFILNAKQNSDFIIRGDGRPARTYLYSSDLVIWLIRLLLNGRHLEAYNVGSDQAVTIEQLARKVKSETSAQGQIIIQSPDQPGPVHRYVPSIEKATQELNLKVWTSLEKSILRTYEFAKSFDF